MVGCKHGGRNYLLQFLLLRLLRSGIRLHPKHGDIERPPRAISDGDEPVPFGHGYLSDKSECVL